MSCALTIASSDSGGGAGIQADLKSFASCGVHGASAIVALTAQNTLAVTAIHPCPVDFVAAQIEAVLADLHPAAVKSGMLFSAEIIETVAGCLHGAALPYVLDPVMLASSGSKLLRDDAIGVMVELLFPLATVITPNLMEAQALTGMFTEDRAEIAEALVSMGARGALVTGGHGSEPIDHLFDGDRHLEIPVARHAVAATHGAGCTHSAAICALLARGFTLTESAVRAAAVAGGAVRHGLVELGGGEGPVDVLDVRAAATRSPLGPVAVGADGDGSILS